MENDENAAVKVLSNEIRREIVSSLWEGAPLGAADFAAMLDMRTEAIMWHLNIMEEAGVIKRVKKGRRNICVLNKEALQAISDWLILQDVSWLDMLNIE